MAVAFANIFMVKEEREILNRSALKQLVWKRFIDDIFSLWDPAREEITQFSLTNTIKISSLRLVEVSETETKFLDTTEYKGERFKTESVLDVHAH